MSVHVFPKGIYPKVNVIVRLEFELAYYDSAVECFNHYTPDTPPDCLLNTHFLFCSVSLFNGISTFTIYSNPSLYKDGRGTL